MKEKKRTRGGQSPQPGNTFRYGQAAVESDGGAGGIEKDSSHIWELNESLKHLDCLYSISRIIERPGITLGEILQRAVEILPPALRYPQAAYARITFGDDVYCTADFTESEWRLSSDITVSGEKAGVLDLYYLEELPPADEGPFLAGERELLNAVAERLGKIIERLRIEKALREEKAFTESALDALTDAFYVLAEDGRMLRWNRALSEGSGYSDEELAGMTVFDFFEGEDAERQPEFYRTLLQRGRAGFEGSVVTKDGRRIPYLFHSTLLKDPDGTPYAICGVGRDISEEKRMEEALKESEEYFRSLIENSYDAVAVLNTDGSIRYASPSFERMTGYRPEEITGRTAFDFIHPDDIPAILQIFTEGIKEPYKSATAEYRFRHKDGTWHYVEAVGRNLLEDAAVRGVVVNYRDITWRKDIEKALRDSEERFRAIAGTAQDAIIMIDDRGRITYWNPAAEKIFGYGSEEATGRDLSAVMIPERYHDLYRSGLASFAEDGKGPIIGRTGELEGRKKDGTVFPIEVSLSSLQIGDRWHAVGIIRDITERKKTEEQLLTANRELEAFAHTLSHDLRTPLSIAYGFAHMLVKTNYDTLSEKGRECLDELILSLVKMDRFITSLLDFASAGRPGGNVNRVNPGEIIDGIVRELTPTIKDKGVEITRDGELPSISVDELRFMQVLSNLIDNAIKHAGGEPHTRIEIGASRENGEVVMHVRDNGGGIPPEKLKEIFDPFTRLRTGGAISGLGIGLSTVKRVVEGWGGRVWAESSPQEGTTFFFTAPAA